MFAQVNENYEIISIVPEKLAVIENIEALNTTDEQAFVDFEAKQQQYFNEKQEIDRRQFTDLEFDHYRGNYDPERFYVSSIIAFIDEYELDLPIDDISDFSNEVFPSEFRKFLNQIHYFSTRFQLRQQRQGTLPTATLIQFNTNYKEQLSENIETIRKIVRQQVEDVNKKEAILDKLNALAKEIDRDRTTMDRVFSLTRDVSRNIAECAEELEPAIQKFERIMHALYNGSEIISALPNTKKTKALPSPEVNKEFSEDTHSGN